MLDTILDVLIAIFSIGLLGALLGVALSFAAEKL